MAHTAGVLILHGFTGSRATVAPLVPVAESLALPWSLPQLRGHWTTPDDLQGVVYEDFLADALAAFDALAAQVAHVAVVGLSMGGLIALDVVSRRQGRVPALVTLAPALRYASKMVRIAPLIARVQKEFRGDSHTSFSGPKYAEGIGNYDRFPTATFLSVLRAVPRIEARLPQIAVPTLVIGARNDRVIPFSASQLVYDRLGSRQKELICLERSGHEMLTDCEAEAAREHIGVFLQRQLAQQGAESRN